MRTFLLSLTLLSVHYLSAQRECGTQDYVEIIKSSDPGIRKKITEAETFISSRLKNNSSASKIAADYIIRIPVVVHVVYSNESQNISDAKIKSQIDILNRDFRRRNEDAVNTPERFKQFAADAQIEFVLATADPKGRPTNGIVRKQTHVQYWQMDDSIKFSEMGGSDAWDSRSYLNIWVGELRSLLGYSSPVGVSADKDGVVLNFSAFGKTSGAYSLGRTAVHEVGHWLGLKHIWGDTYCGDDEVDDTPKQGGFTSGCPSGVRITCSNTPLGDMYMNYMDFTNDACMNMFTRGQRERMRAQFEQGAPRASILSSKGLHEPWVQEEIPVKDSVPVSEPIPTGPVQLKLYPNPVGSEMMLDFEYDPSWVGSEIVLVSMNGVPMQRIKVTSKIQKVYLTNLRAGVYFIQGFNKGKKLNQKLVKL